MKISRRVIDDVLILTPEVRRIDAFEAVEFRTALLAPVKQGRTHLIVNLREVDFIDSSGLGALVSVVKNLGEDGRFAVCELRDGVRSILELTRLDRVLDLHVSEKDAVESLKKE